MYERFLPVLQPNIRMILWYSLSQVNDTFGNKATAFQSQSF